METTTEIKVRLTKESRLSELETESLEFGNLISDHMFRSIYKNKEWNNAEILPFANLSLSPATLALHYGQSIFEGMKAFRVDDKHINIFRLNKHYERLNRSLQRMCMPEIPYDLFINAIKQLVSIDKAWVPSNPGALYLRPFVFASEARFGVKVADEYSFIIFSGPVAPIYAKALKVKVEREFIRAAKGGTGFAKCAGNYGGAFYPTQLAKEEGFDQLLWTDAAKNEFIEESGTMNVFFVIDNTLITPALSDTILDGVTRDSLVIIAQKMGFKVEERPIGVTELSNAFRDNKITEAFGAGTAAVVAPIASINIDGWDYMLPQYNDGNIMFRLKERLESLRHGKEPDIFNWNTII